MKKRLSIALLSLLLVFPAFAQDATEAPTPAPEVTEVVQLPPVSTITPIETALPPETPRGGFTVTELMPYIVPIAIIFVLAFFALFGGVVFALWKSVPAALKPIAYPMLESGSGALLNMADNYAKSTPSKADDELVADLRAEMNAKLKALYEEMQAQRAALLGSANHVG